MRKNIKKISGIIMTVVLISLLLTTNKSFAGFADFDDKTADQQANEQIKEQELQDEQNLGKSSNNFLTSLSVEGYSITPQFSRQTVNYSIEGEITKDTIIINAIPEDAKATVTGTGEVTLQSGENEIKIDVLAENGVQRTYFISVNKKVEEKSLKLKEIKLAIIDNNQSTENLDLNPEFSEDVFKYTCKVNSEVTKIDVSALAKTDNAKVKVGGNDNLQAGSNIVTISLTSEETKNETIYKIEVIKDGPKEVSNIINEESNNYNKYIIAIVVAIVIIILISLLIVKNKKSNKKNKRKH